MLKTQNLILKSRQMLKKGPQLSTVQKGVSSIGQINPSIQRQANAQRYHQFSRQVTGYNVGQLPFGEIPEPLKYEKALEVSTISNGIRVCTTTWNSPLAAVGVFIGAGSRNESIATSGAAHFLEHLHFKGSQKRTRIQLEKEIENLGSQLNAYTSREHTLYHMLSFNQNLDHSVEVLGDMLCHSTYDNYHLEMEKETIWQELLATNQDFMETLMENVYNNIYREHMMGQPILGIIDNIYEIKREMVVDFHKTNYYGENIVIVGTGNIEHQRLVELAQKHFDSLPRRAQKVANGLEKPDFHRSLMFISDDEMMNSNAGVFYEAPGWKHNDFYAFLLLQRIFGNYSTERNAEHLQDIDSHYSSMHRLLAEMPDVTRHDCIFSPYSDTGIFGHYLFGNDHFSRQLNYCGEVLHHIFTRDISEVEIARAKQKLYLELLSIESATDDLQQIGPQMLYLNRHVSRTEIAKRVACIDSHLLKDVCKRWFEGKEASITNWGPRHGINHEGSYKYFKVNSVNPTTDLGQLIREQ